jgi:hypothetical protein
MLTKSMEQSLSSEGNSCLAGQEISSPCMELEGL